MTELTQIVSAGLEVTREEVTASLEIVYDPTSPPPKVGERIEWIVTVVDVDCTRSRRYRGTVTWIELPDGKVPRDALLTYKVQASNVEEVR